MLHKAWSSIVEVPYCFSRSSIKFQGHTALKIVEFDPDWAFPDCNSSFNTPMVTKWCTKLETAKERCPIVFQGHPSNFKVTRYKTSPILTQLGRFRTIGQSQLSNPSDLPCFLMGDCSPGLRTTCTQYWPDWPNAGFQLHPYDYIQYMIEWQQLKVISDHSGYGPSQIERWFYLSLTDSMIPEWLWRSFWVWAQAVRDSITK